MTSRFSLSIIIIVLCTTLAGASTGDNRPPWLDSAINCATKKILAFEVANDKKFATTFINIDLALWTGQITDNIYYYEKAPGPAELVFSPDDYSAIVDSVSKLNMGWKTNGAAPYCLYVLYLKNFPVKLDKDVDTSLMSGEGSIKDKLNKLGALNDANLQHTTSRVIEIIDAIYNKIHSVNSAPNRILYTIATLYGQHAPGKRLIPLSFLSDIKTGGPDIDNSPYKQDLEYFPKGYYQRNKYDKVDVLPTLKNSVFALVSQINCQFNNKCYLNLASLRHQASRDIYKEYAGKGIDELLLRRIVLEIDKMDNRSLFDLLHYFRDKHAVELHNDLFPIPYPHTPTTGEMQTFFEFANKFNHLQNKLKGLISERDTLLMAGYFNRFNTELIKSISLPVRIAHLEKLCAGNCSDFNSVSQIADYEHACEEFALSLLKNIPENEERLLLDKVRGSGLLWKLSYSLDNSTFSFVGKNNYTIFINLISNYWKKGYNNCFTANSGSGKDPVIVFWKETFFSNNNLFANDVPNNKIKFYQWDENTGSYASDPFRSIDVYEPVMIYLTEPSAVLGLDKGTTLVVPAIYLDFLQWRKALQDLTTATAVAIDIAALATGIGELYQAASIGTRVIASIEIAVSTMDLAIQNQQIENAIVSCFDVEQEGRDFIAAYKNVSAIVNCGIAAKGLIANFAEKCKQFDDLYKKGEQELSGAFKTAHPEEAAKIEALEKEIKEQGLVDVQSAPPVADLFDLNIFKGLQGRTPSGKNLTNLRKIEFTDFGYRLRPSSGSIKNSIDDIISNGDYLGSKTEKIVDDIMGESGYTKLDGKYGSNNGYDGIYIKGDLVNPEEIVIIESKQFKYVNGSDDEIVEHNGVSLNPPSSTTALPAQMSDEWIQYVQNKLRQEGKLSVADLIRDFDYKIQKYVTAVDKTKGEINFLKLASY